jgi:hypothetical protein
MLRHRRTILAAIAAMVAGSSIVLAQGPPDPAALIAAQRAGLASLSYMDGVWRGPATVTTPSGEKQTVTQTERIGPFLDGSVRVIEGRGYRADGSVGFNAFGIISYNPRDKTYNLRSYAQGMQGDFVLTPTADGYVWEIPAGPATIRYTATIKNGSWREVGDRIMAGSAPVRFFEMNLVRVGDSDWPGAGAVKQK